MSTDNNMDTLDKSNSTNRYIMMANGSVYHTRNCVCIQILPKDEILYIMNEKPTKYNKCNECIKDENLLLKEKS